MFRKVLFFAFAISILLTCSVQAAVIDSNWVGGERGFWEDNVNWVPSIVPDNNETQKFRVTVVGGESGVEILIQEDHEVNRLDTYGEVELSGHDWRRDPDLTVLEPNGLTNHGHLEIEELDIYGNVINMTGALFEGDGTDIEEGDLCNELGGTVKVDVAWVNVDDGNIHNSGTVSLIPGGKIWAEQFENFGLIEIYDGTCASGQAFHNHFTGTIKGSGVIHSQGLISNEGHIKSVAGSLVLHSYPEFGEAPDSNSGVMNTGTLTNSPGTSLTVMVWVPDINNQGTIEVNAGGGVTFDCNFVNEPNGIINLLGGNLAATSITQTADANFAGFGGISGDVVIEPNGLIELTGPTNIVGDVTIDPNATLEISDGTTLITGDCACNNGTIHMIGGRVIIQGTFTNDNCNIIWEPGTYTNAADFNLDGTVNNKDLAAIAGTWLWQAAWY